MVTVSHSVAKTKITHISCGMYSKVIIVDCLTSLGSPDLLDCYWFLLVVCVLRYITYWYTFEFLDIKVFKLIKHLGIQVAVIR